MKNFTNNFKQFTSRLSARWLIMALMLLVGTSSAWGWTVYYDNTETQWSNVYVVLGHDSYHRGDYKMTKVSDSENLYYLTKDDWGDAKYVTFSNTIVAQNGSNSGFKTAITSGYYSFNNGASSLNHLLFKKNGTNLTTIEGLYPRLIFNCNHIGFYVGEYQNWNNQQFYVHTQNSDHISSISPFKDGTTSYYGVVYATSKKYNITHSMSWNGPALTISTALGYAYLVTGDNSIDASKKSTELSCDFSIDNTIKAGETTTVLSNSTSGKSYFANNANKKYEVDSYYVKKSGETSLTKLEVEGSELQTQSLAVGEYTIYVLLFDGRIYAKGGEQTLTVETACDKPDAPNFGTNGVEVCEGTQVTLPTITDVNLKWYDNNNQEITDKTFNAIETQTYYAVVVGDCESDKTSYTITIKTKPIVTLNPNENTVCTDVTLGDITDYVEIESTNGSQISWYAAAQGGDALATSTPLMETSYFAEATFNGCSSDRAEFTITDVLSAPTEVPNVTAPETICDGGSAVLELKNKDANYTYTVNEVKVDFTNNEYTVSPQETTSYTIKAENKCGYKETTISITVNPLPTINIGEDVTAVKFEDVVLTATGENIANVVWTTDEDKGTITKDATDPKKAVLTYDQADAVIVTATATSEDGCTSATTKTVTFGEEEDCTPTPDNTKIEIWCQVTGTTTPYCHAFNITPSGNNGFANWPGLTHTSKSGDYYIWTLDNTNGLDISNNKVGIVFSKNSSGDNQTADITTLYVGNRYYFTYNANSNDKNTNYTQVKSEPLTTPVPLSAPAVKTVSATSEEGSGVVNFTGKIIKTGCATKNNIHYGYQFKKEGEDWPTTGVEASNTPVKGKLIPLTNASETALYYQFSANVENLENGIYYFRAYIINGYEFSNGNYDQGVYYGIDIPVTVSTQKDPIRNLQVKYADDKGGVLQDQNVTYCVGDDAYIKLIYDGSKLKPEEDEINISSTLENTFTLVDGIADLYTFVVKGNETITVNAKNKENTDNPTAELTINTYAVPVIPSIDIDKTTICSNDATGAKITVSNPQVGITYQVYKILGESEPTTHGEPKKYSEGVLEFNSMTQAGTYYVRAYNEQCPKAIAQSLDEILTVIDADATSISISPETKTVNPWVPVTFTVSKEGNYDYTFSCKEKENESENDVTSNMVINKSGDTYVVKFPKPDGVSAATDLNGQVTFADKTYYVEVKLNADVQCGTVSDESVVTLKPVNEICN